VKLFRLFKSSKEKNAVIYAVNGRIVVATVQKTTAGVGLENDPQPIDPPFAPEDIALKLGKALESSAHVVPHPAQSEWKGSFEPMARAAGVRSWKAFAASAELVSVREAGGSYSITPWKNLGARDGFEPIPDQQLTLSGDLKSVAENILERLIKN
jgi:hypothetical protein